MRSSPGKSPAAADSPIRPTASIHSCSNNSTPKRMVTETVLAAPKAGEVTLKLGDPLLIYSRFDLNSMLLERAEQAGAQIEKTRVTGMERQGAGWRLQDARRESSMRISASSPRARAIRCATSGTQLDAAGHHVRAGILRAGRSGRRSTFSSCRDLEGYIWIFPRCGHLSVGICGKGEPAAAAAQTAGGLHGRSAASVGRTRRSTATCCPRWIEIVEGKPRGGRRLDGGGRCRGTGGSDHRRGPVLRAFARATWRRRACWPTRAVRRKACIAYRTLLRRDFAADLEFGSRLAKRVFLGRFLFGSVPAAHGGIHAPQSRASPT